VLTFNHFFQDGRGRHLPGRSPKTAAVREGERDRCLSSDKAKGATGHGRREYCLIVLMLLKKTAAQNAAVLLCLKTLFTEI